MCGILNTWMDLTLFLTISSIRYVAGIVLEQFRILFIHLNRSLSVSLSHVENYNKLSIIFNRLEKLFSLKFQLTNIFGGQLLLNFTYDFVVMTISIYSAIYFARPSMLQYGTMIIVFYYIVFQILPHALKVTVVSNIMDKLEGIVNLFNQLTSGNPIIHLFYTIILIIY